MIRNTKKVFTLGINHCARRSNVYSTKNLEESVQSTEGVVISDTCAQRLKELCSDDPDKAFLRLAVESGGCSGFQYKFDLDSQLAEDDRIFEKEGVKVVIDETSLSYIRGSTIDFHKELIRSAFRVVQNPNADLGCSCGASFSVKID